MKNEMEKPGLVAVLGGTGRVGRSVVDALRMHGFPVRILTRSEQKRDALPPDIDVIVGDPHDWKVLESLVDAAYGLFFVSLHDEHELQIGRNVIAAAQAASVQKIVYSSAAYPSPKNALARKLFWAFFGLTSPHYKPKLTLDAAVRKLRNGTVLMPANFFQNDILYRRDILEESIYPQPVGTKGTCRIDVRDIGDAAVRIFSEDGHGRQAYPLAGPVMNGEQCAAVLSEVLGKSIKYAGDDLDAWEQRVKDRLAPKERQDFRKSYALMQKVGFGLPQDAQDEGTALLRKSYRQYIDFAREFLQ